MPRVAEPVVLGGPHLVLADAGDDDRLALREVRDLLHDVLGLDQLVVPVVAERVLLQPLRQLAEPLLPRLPRRRGRLLPLLRRASTSCASTGARRRRSGRHLDVLRDRGRVDVDVDDLGVRRELVDLPGDAVVEPGADRDQAVGL